MSLKILDLLMSLGGGVLLGLSLLFAFNGELDKAQLLALYAIAVWINRHV